MVKQSELEVMVCDLFVDAYRAGQSCGDLAYNAARGTRSRLIKELGEVYAELQQESYHREQLEVELQKAQHQIEGLQRDYDHMCEIKDRLLMTNRSKDAKLKELGYMEADVAATEWLKKHTTVFDDIPDEEVPDHHDAFDSMFPGCTPDDLPFPDVETGMSPAEEVYGADE